MNIFSAAHEGYIDGLLGKEPQSTYEEYETGWLHGVEDQGKVDPSTFETSLKRGDTIRVPKGLELLYNEGTTGRSFSVKLHDVYRMVPAHLDHTHYRESNPSQGFFVKPSPPIVLWAGSGGYWRHAYANQVTKVEE